MCEVPKRGNSKEKVLILESSCVSHHKIIRHNRDITLHLQKGLLHHYSSNMARNEQADIAFMAKYFYKIEVNLAVNASRCRCIVMHRHVFPSVPVMFLCGRLWFCVTVGVRAQ